MRKTRIPPPKPLRAAPRIAKDSTLIKPKLNEEEGSGEHCRRRPVKPLSGKKLAVEISNRPKRVQAITEFAKREAEKLTVAAIVPGELTTLAPAFTFTVTNTGAVGRQDEEPFAKRPRVLDYERPTREVSRGGHKRRAVQGDIVSLWSSNG